MDSTVSVIKTLIVPAVVALLVFLVLSYAIVPLWRRYRNRYGQYLPLDAVTAQTSSLRQRVQHGVARMLVPSTWRQRLQDRLVIGNDAISDADEYSLEQEGEELGEVENAGRRRGLSSDRAGGGYDTRRLSRDLEQGFMDDSDSDSSDD